MNLYKTVVLVKVGEYYKINFPKNPGLLALG